MTLESLLTDGPECFRFPRDLENSAEAVRVREQLMRSRCPLRPGKGAMVPELPLTPELRRALNAVNLAGRLSRGLETAGKILAAEDRGMAGVDQRTGRVRGERISRMILVTGDGSDRFYRQVETLMERHGKRLLVVRLQQTDAATLGAALFGPGARARLVMVTHRAAVVRILTAIVPSVYE